MLRIGPGFPVAIRVSPEPASYRAGPQASRWPDSARARLEGYRHRKAVSHLEHRHADRRGPDEGFEVGPRALRVRG